MIAAAHPLVHLNAGLNATATVLLVVGFVLIKQRRELAHKRVMLTAFGVSTLFLACYLWYHYQVGHVEFAHSGVLRAIYLTILGTHIVLAMTVPVLAFWTIYRGFRATGCCQAKFAADQRRQIEARYRGKHRQLARWTYPIWLYVSITGVIVYVMLYHLWPPIPD